MRRPTTLLALLLVLAYLGLGMLSAACAAEHAEDGAFPHQHHHGNSFSHSSFCAWACQANPASAASWPSLGSEPLRVSILVMEYDRSLPAQRPGSLSTSRAPPLRS
ncbi:MAG TPA: hypothetical protein VFQ34_06750 [Nitrospiraceae bacterium]|nr:hypothetical protein [Nitrospiraceae bacterium]